MKRPMSFARSSVFSSLIAVCTLTIPSLTWGHAYPLAMVPADGSTVSQAPREIRIQFTEAVELEFSRVEVKLSNGARFVQGKLRKIGVDALAVELRPLVAGNYIVEWQVLSVDTHITEGVLRFTFNPVEP